MGPHQIWNQKDIRLRWRGMMTLSARPHPEPPAPTIDLAEADAVQFDIDDLLSDDRT